MIVPGLCRKLSAERSGIESENDSIPALLLQKPHARSKTNEHTKHMDSRLNLWKDGDPASLLDEGQTIQGQLARE